MLNEGEEDDEDVFDTLVRVLGNAGGGIGRAGARMGRKLAGAKGGDGVGKLFGRNVFGRFGSR